MNTLEINTIINIQNSGKMKEQRITQLETKVDKRNIKKYEFYELYNKHYKFGIDEIKYWWKKYTTNIRPKNERV